MRIICDALENADVVALIALHLCEAYANSPPDSVFALDMSGLRDPAVTLWSCWDDDVLAGIGALKQLAPLHGELKSMRTSPDRLRRGVGRTMLDHLIAEARARGYGHVSLETGSTAAYAPARSLYEQAGFVPCAPFGAYEDTVFSRYYSLELQALPPCAAC